MIKKVLFLLFLGLTISSAQAFDKNQVDLDKEFWGTWTLYNPQTKCTEVFNFKKPGDFTYQVNKKLLVGNFAVVRSNSSGLDLLMMNVKTDNKLEGCASDQNDYSNVNIQLALKWTSPQRAEVCTDAEAKQCSGLFLIKSK